MNNMTKTEKVQEAFQEKKSNINSIMSISFGIVGLLAYYYLGIFNGLISLVFGAIGLYKHEKRLYSITGIALGGILITLGLTIGYFSVL